MSWYDTFINKQTNRAAWIGIAIYAMQHTSLNMGLIMYSSSFLEKLGVNVAIGNVILLSANWFGNLPAFFLLSNYGRKTN